ncbi:MAG: hypothetical protein N4A35_17495 [Flavobacteriales bacterium]|nr:hypothetical protein [Flavobacteriales bacterium]
MNKLITIFCSAALLGVACDKEIRNIAPQPATPIQQEFSREVNPVNINDEGFELLENLQGHWVGENLIMADNYEWFSFDYRPISESHIHGLFEGGTMGNLLTSFFVTDFKNTRTIMARNGGLLNGIYRCSYFVLDSVNTTNTESFYRLVDAVGGQRAMWMELKFTQDSLYFNAYTSRLGLLEPTRHMTFKAVNEDISMAQAAATTVQFPQNIPAWDFSNGFVQQNLYVNSGVDTASSATFLSQGAGDVFSLSVQSGDPFTIADHPYIGMLQVDVTRNPLIQNENLLIYLSRDPLTDNSGYFDVNNFNSILLFPEIVGTQDQFTFTYLHPGNYYINVIADKDGDGGPSQGDVTHVAQPITITANGVQQITINNVTIQN